jgi:hypothetical protein
MAMDLINSLYNCFVPAFIRVPPVAKPLMDALADKEASPMIGKLGFWPLGPMVSSKIILGVLAVAGVVFSIVILIDCLKRPAKKFPNPLTKNGAYDRLIWAAAIIVSLWFYFLGAIVYFFVVKQAKGKDAEDKD